MTAKVNELKIKVLVENCVEKRGLLAEHGLSLLIETGPARILFDTGQGTALRHNAEPLQLDLKQVTDVALSHGHYDHTGGLAFALNGMHEPRLYMHPAALDLKYARNSDGSARTVGMASGDKIVAEELAEIIPVEARTELAGGLFLTGPVPRLTDFEDTGGAFFRDRTCTEPDPLPDDQAAFAETAEGTVVILGCAHAGVINTLHYIQQLTGGRPIHSVIGGMHLVNAGPERMERTVVALRRFNLQRLIPCHCTGFPATLRLWKEFPGICERCAVGSVFTWGSA